MSSSREKLLAQFRELALERLQKIARFLVTLEAGADVEAGKATLRELHGLKGEARMMGFADVNTLVHQMEDLVRATEPAGYALEAASVDALLVTSDAVSVLTGATQGETPDVAKLTDWLGQRVAGERERLGAGSSAPRASSPVPSASPSAPPGVSPSTPLGGAFTPVPTPSPVSSSPSRGPGVVSPSAVMGSGPSGVLRSGATPPPIARSSPSGTQVGVPAVGSAVTHTASDRTASVKAVSRGDQAIRISHKSLEVLTSTATNLSQRGRRREIGAVKRRKLTRELVQLHRLAEDLGPQAAELAARLGKIKELAGEIDRVTTMLNTEELRDLTVLTEEIQGLRMLPLGVLFESYPRMVRELARDLGKEVDLTIEGEHQAVDRTVLDALRDPLLHLVRNAIDHGIETRAERVEQGKPPRGVLFLRARREGERIVLAVEDDGRGLDPRVIREVAVRRGILDEANARLLTDQAAIDLVFLPGFSSKAEATDVSGRGVGLDVVRTTLMQVGGEATIHTTPGAGARFDVRVPVSLTVAPVLFVQVGDEQLCLSAGSVVRALQVEADQVKELAGRPALKVEDEVLPFASAMSILGAAPERKPSEGDLVLVLRGRGQQAAVAVDRVLDERVQAIFPLRGLLSRFHHLSGATPLPDGGLALVLSAPHLVATASGRELKLTTAPRTRQVAKKRRILVVDDSPLTRDLLVSLLEAVGYHILQAQDGAEALERLGREAVDLVVTDLEMPKVDGLELTRRVKSHATLRSLPVVIVTTRGSEADRRKGMEAGADGYVAKGDLVRQDLVDIVARLLV